MLHGLIQKLAKNHFRLRYIFFILNLFDLFLKWGSVDGLRGRNGERGGHGVVWGGGTGRTSANEVMRQDTLLVVR